MLRAGASGLLEPEDRIGAFKLVPERGYGSSPAQLRDLRGDPAQRGVRNVPALPVSMIFMPQQ